MRINYIIVISLILSFLTSCKRPIKSEILTLSKNKIEEKIIVKDIKFNITNLKGRFEFFVYKNEQSILGEFYSPKTDTLMMFTFNPINQEGIRALNEIGKKFGGEYKTKQNILLNRLDDFKITGYKIDYSYVLEQKDAGGSPVFNIKEPFKAQKFIYKDGIITMDKIKSYKSFDVVYY